jgi:hypothetical protein
VPSYKCKGGKEEDTATKFDLRKIKSFFGQTSAGGNEIGTTNLKTSSNIEEVGVPWAVTTSEVQLEGKGPLRKESEDVIGRCVDPWAVWTNGK